MASPQPGKALAVSADAAPAHGSAVKPNRAVRAEYLEAFRGIVARIAEAVGPAASAKGPIRMYVAGGAALHLMTGARVSEDIDATFSRRIVLGDDLSVSYRDADGRARILYLDRNYNDTLGLLHEDAYDDSLPLAIPGIDAKAVEVRVLSPLDLAVSKLARFSDQDRSDVETLARAGLVEAASLRRRASEALGGYVGDLESIRSSIEIACRIVDAVQGGKRR